MFRQGAMAGDILPELQRSLTRRVVFAFLVIGVAVGYVWLKAGPILPSWVEVPSRLSGRIQQVERDCKNPARDVVNWEICESAGSRFVWINYPGEYSAYDAETGYLVYYRTGFRCDPAGPWFFPWLRKTCGRTSREFGAVPSCGGSHCDPEEWASPCTQDQLSRLGCGNFSDLREILRRHRS